MSDFRAASIPLWAKRGHFRGVFRLFGCASLLSLGLMLTAGWGGRAAAVEVSEGREWIRAGDYRKAAEAAGEVLSKNERHEEWRLLQFEALLAEGRYPESYHIATNALRRFGSSLRLRWAAREVFLKNNDAERAQEMMEDLVRLGTQRFSVRDAASVVALGRAALLTGADPKAVLDNLYERAKTLEADSRDPWMAAGELALAKGDFQLAAKTYEAALKKFEKDPDLLLGLARAYAPNQRSAMVEMAGKALEINPRHVGSMLLLAESAIDAEQYEQAEEQIAKALKVNPHDAEALALRAVIRHLRHDLDGEKADREAALRFGSSNPAVDHLIGRKLSQKYRFTEGAERQKRALALAPDFLPAKVQLAQDLLRLGEETEGWGLADEVHEKDGYDVTAFNLMNLKDVMRKFRTLTNEHFIVRMEAKESELYGDKVLEVLEMARTNLCAKYQVTPPRPVIVEIFPNQKDFGVRTFGMPENPGFLGVCFGPVITANSPATQKTGVANWHAVLYHEFCHVLTLQLTRNRMPRWLSEGISVHEERLRHRGWGQQMTERFRERILEGKAKPVAEMSGAFLTARTSEDMQFAYYQSSLVVDFLVEKYGYSKLREILVDLGEGVWINDAIQKRTAPMAEIEKAFAAFARARAEALAPGLDFRKPAVLGLSEPDAKVAWEFPTNAVVQRAFVQRLLEEEKWEEAKAPLRRLAELHPNHAAADSALVLLARVHRKLKEAAAERDALERLAGIDADATEAYARLIELAMDAKDDSAVRTNALRWLEVSPASMPAYRALGESAERLSRWGEAVMAWRSVLKLDPPDLADVHFKLATLLWRQRDAGARRHVLLALEEAPRYREAQKLLLEMASARPAAVRREP
ncbi:MAG: tetratricopeptide repeat protein [Verrucomicrobia bacterium]|nr:tetratricopeptide repeat protein [Verrucomicrobiota bacterium]